MLDILFVLCSVFYQLRSCRIRFVCSWDTLETLVPCYQFLYYCAFICSHIPNLKSLSFCLFSYYISLERHRIGKKGFTTVSTDRFWICVFVFLISHIFSVISWYTIIFHEEAFVVFICCWPFNIKFILSCIIFTYPTWYTYPMSSEVWRVYSSWFHLIGLQTRTKEERKKAKNSFFWGLPHL